MRRSAKPMATHESHKVPPHAYLTMLTAVHRHYFLAVHILLTPHHSSIATTTTIITGGMHLHVKTDADALCGRLAA